MQLTETARIRLLIDGKEAVSELSALDSKYADLIESRNKFTRGTAQWKEFNEAAKETKATISSVRERMEVTNMTYNESVKYQKEIVKAMRDMKEGTDDYNKSAGRLKEVNTHLAGIKSDLNSTHQEVKPGIWSNLGTAIKGAFVVGAIVEFGKMVLAAGVAVFELTAKFEKYKTVLSNTLGGQQEATAAMEMIKDIAATTPVSVDEMTESFVKMVNRGLKPSKDEIKNLADLAASQGKSFDQLTEAVLDAMMGEGERLKEFGVKMKKTGDDVTLNFKGQTVAVKNNEQAIYDAIVAMGDYAGVAGMTSEMSKTLEGRVSNLGDAWDFVQLKLGDKLMPIFVKVLELFADGVEWVSDFIDELGPLGTAFTTVWEVLGMVWDMGKNLFLALLPKAAENSLTTANYIKYLATVLTAVATVVRIVFGTIQLLVDGFIALGNASRVVGNVLIGDFESAAKAAGDLGTSWSTLKSNASKNFGGITDSFKKIWTDTKKDTDAAAGSVDMYGKLTKKTEEEITDKKGKEADKQNKINQDAAAKTKILNAQSLNDKIATENAKYEVERQKIEKSKVDAATKKNLLDALENAHHATIKKLNQEKLTDEQKLNDKIVKERESLHKQLDKIFIDALDNEYDKKIVSLQQKYEADVKFIEDTELAEKEKNDLLLKLHTTLTSDIAKINRDRLADEKKITEDKVKSETEAAEKIRQAEFDKQDKIVGKYQGTFSSIKSLLDGNVSAYADANEKNISAAQYGKLKLIGFAMEVASFISDKLNEVVGKFADTARAMIEIGQLRLEKEMLQIDNGAKKATESKRAELKDLETQIKAFDLEIARLTLEAYTTKDADRQADLQKEITRLENEKQHTVLQKNVITGEIDKIQTDYDIKVRQQRLDAWHKQKDLEVKMAIINQTQAYIKALSSGFPPFNFATAVMVSLAAKEQIELIRSELPPDFEKGTFQPMRDDTYFENAGILGGVRHSHSSGGNLVINPSNGKLLARVEAGEFMGVFSRDVTAKHGQLLARLANSSLSTTGKPVFAQEGYFGNINSGDSYESGSSQVYQMAIDSTSGINKTAQSTTMAAEELAKVNSSLSIAINILSNIQSASEVTAAKNLSISINNIIDTSQVIADIDRRSSFRP